MNNESGMKKKSVIVRCAADVFLPLAAVFGCYVIFHGNTSPGGGFQGGVLVASAILLVFLGYGLSGVNKTFRYHFLHSSETVAEILYVVIGLVGIAAGLNFCKNFIFSPAAQLESTNLMNDAVGYHVMAGIACLLIMMLSLLSEDDDEQPGQPEEEVPAEEAPAEEQPEAAADSAQEVTEESIPDAAPEEVPAEQEVTA